MDAFHPAEYLRDELEARGWTSADMALRMPGDPRVNELSIDLLLASLEAPEGHGIHNMRIGKSIALSIAIATDTNPETWLRLQEKHDEDINKRFGLSQ